MILKSKEEIELIRISSLLVGKTLAEVSKKIQPGVSLVSLDMLAEEFIRDHEALPGFKGLYGCPSTLLTSVNEQVVHGLPTSYELKEGDVVSIDCGVKKNDYYGDSAYTFTVGEISKEKQKLLEVTKKALYLGIEMAVAGNRVGDISASIQTYCESFGYGVVRELVGHGLGKDLHEAPEVPNFGKKGKGPMLKEGLVIAIEPMINMGKKEVKQLSDGWTIVTKDHLPSAHFEHTVCIGAQGADILSTFEEIEEIEEIEKLKYA